MLYRIAFGTLKIETSLVAKILSNLLVVFTIYKLSFTIFSFTIFTFTGSNKITQRLTRDCTDKENLKTIQDGRPPGRRLVIA